MKNPGLQKDAMHAMVIMNAAITNIRLYPPSSALISNSIDKAYSAIQAILEKEDSLVFAEAEKNLLISGQPLSEKDQQQPQVIAFLELLLSFGIKTISFEKELERADLISFLEIVSRKPEDVEKEGGLQETLKKQKLSHITLDQKVYVAMDKDQQILAGLNIKDQEIVKYLMGDGTASDIDTEKIREMATNPEWITQVFQSGLKNVKKDAKGDNLTSQLSHTVGQMIHSLDNIAGSEDKEQIFQNIAGFIANMDDEALSTILTENVDDMLENDLFDDIVNQLDDNRFEVFASKIIGMSNRPVTDDGSANELLNRAYENMMHSDKGKRLGKSIKDKAGRAKKLKEKHVAHLKAGVSSILKGEKKAFEDKLVMQSLPTTVCQLFLKEKNKTAEAIIDKLCGELLVDKPDVRADVSQVLSRIGEKLGEKLSAYPAAENALEMINKGLAKADETKPSEIKDTTPSTDSTLKKIENKTAEEDGVKQHLKSVDELVGKNDSEAAVKLLFDLIVKYAKGKKFTQAEVLRQKLYDVDSMALTEIVRSGEIIEEEKSESIDQDHLDIWPALYDTLTKEEANALYYAMKEAVYDADKIIIKQGKLNSNLYFIMQGEVKIVYRQDDREMLLTRLGAGNIAGEDTFFSITVCTTSMISLTRVKLTYLEKNILTKWKDEFPAIESKLHNYCLSLEKTHDLLKKKGMDRRAQKRVNISGKATIQLLNASKKPIGKAFRGNLSDISVGGLSLFITTSKKETASLLIGRNLNVKFIIPGSEPQQKVDQNAVVIGVHYHLNNEYSIHMKFESKLSDKIIEDVENLKNPISPGRQT